MKRPFECHLCKASAAPTQISFHASNSCWSPPTHRGVRMNIQTMPMIHICSLSSFSCYVASPWYVAAPHVVVCHNKCSSWDTHYLRTAIPEHLRRVNSSHDSCLSLQGNTDPRRGWELELYTNHCNDDFISLFIVCSLYKHITQAFTMHSI